MLYHVVPSKKENQIKLPKKLAQKMDEQVKIFAHHGHIIIQGESIPASCIFCSSIQNILSFKMTFICQSCVKKIATIKK